MVTTVDKKNSQFSDAVRELTGTGFEIVNESGGCAEVLTPMLDEDGDHIGFYVRRIAGGYTFSDCGEFFSSLWIRGLDARPNGEMAGKVDALLRGTNAVRNGSDIVSRSVYYNHHIAEAVDEFARTLEMLYTTAW